MGSKEDSPLVVERRRKVAELRKRGVEPFPWSFPDRLPAHEVSEKASSLADSEGVTSPPVRVAGRLRAIRQHGKTAFADVEDVTGSIQLFLRIDELGEAGFNQLLHDLDPGDIVGATGRPYRTRRGEPSLRVERLEILSKAIAPPPEKWHGVQDPELRLRKRYLDLMSSEESRKRFTVRSLLVRELRHFLDGKGFLEVETPVLVPIASGAAAEPFATRSNYLGEELQLRISLELPLKRLLVGGLERVYEVGRIFRNEDMDSTHAPEFTMMELYWAYADYTDMRSLIESLYDRLAHRVAELWPENAAAARAPELFHPPFASLDYVEALERLSGIRDVVNLGVDALREKARAIGATVPADSPKGKFLDKLFEHFVEPTLERPTFILDYPEITTPLAKRHRSKPGRVERFELFWRGVELGNAYTELNDPDEQESRFQAQLSARGEDHYAYDADFIEALRSGMPPATGVGIGIDRMVMALTGTASIKDVILFAPTRSVGAAPRENR
ncbi:MAG TPA: lysine--tRNA ligase [Thermoplasmata archaeon]|nr:lysine--tRNA ligase [Thermoplasmata archaeon]